MKDPSIRLDGWPILTKLPPGTSEECYTSPTDYKNPVIHMTLTTAECRLPDSVITIVFTTYNVSFRL